MPRLRNLAGMLVITLFAIEAGAATLKVPPHAEAKLPGTNIDSVKTLSWLNGNWTAKGAKGTVRLKAHSIGDSNYIYITFMDDKDRVSQLQVLGFSPRVKTVISWSYDDDGGFGKSIWKQNGNDWLIKSIATHPPGKKGMAKYKLHKIDDNTFTWKSTARTFDGRRLPDTTEVTVNRDLEGGK